MSIIYIFLLVTCIPIQVIGDFNHSSPELHLKYGGHALNALRRLLNFFESDAKNLNLDGLYGLRIAQGQLNALKSSIYQEKTITDKKKIIYSLSIQIERIANESLNNIEHEESSYLHRFALIAYRPFQIEYQSRKLSKDLIDNGERSSDFDEIESDKCFAELLGSTGRPHATKCLISTSCWKIMTSSMTKDYRLTHQLLWFVMAKNIGCIDEQIADKKLNHFEDYFCANIYEDANNNLENNINQDLFLEQLLLCSIIGYEEFLRSDWLNAILSWQHPQYNCFSDESETIRFHRQIKRHLLFEQSMNNGCLSHKSGLAAGLLATYSRVFLK